MTDTHTSSRVESAARSATATARSSTASTCRCRPGRITAIVGANACGKSTLLRALARLLTAARAAGSCSTARTLHRLPTKEVARTLGLLPQSPIAPEGIVVADLVARGRHPHQRLLSRWTARGRRGGRPGAGATDIAELADRSVDELSGGQRQRVWIAMALAQETDILLLDEPTTFLDVAHQVEVLDLLTDLNRDRGTTIVMVLHDLNLAARYADHLVAMRRRPHRSPGAPAEVLTAELVARGLRPGQPGRPRSGLRHADRAAHRPPPHHGVKSLASR